MNESNGYVKAPHDIVRSPDLSPAAKVAWLLIAGMPEGYHPTREQWMAMLPCRDKSTWQKTVAELENAGLVEVEKHGTKPVFKAVLKGGKIHPPKGEKITPQRVEKTTLEGWKNPPSKGWKKPPYMKNIIEEQLKNDVEEARARVIANLKTYDQWAESMCINHRLTHEELCAKVDEFAIAMACGDRKIEELQNARSYFNAWLTNNNRNNGQTTATIRQPIAEGRAARAAGIAATMAALGAASGKPQDIPY